MKEADGRGWGLLIKSSSRHVLHPSAASCQQAISSFFCFFVFSWVSEWVSEVAQSCPTLCDPVDCRPPGSSVHGILQAGILEWVAISFSRGSSWPRDWTQVSRIAGRRLNLWATREALSRWITYERITPNISKDSKPRKRAHQIVQTFAKILIYFMLFRLRYYL